VVPNAHARIQKRQLTGHQDSRETGLETRRITPEELIVPGLFHAGVCAHVLRHRYHLDPLSG
jgi:hypothetical protein